MRTIGIRALRTRLREVVRYVEAGAHILVTDRGSVVAELVPPGYQRSRADVPAGLARLADRGLIRLGKPNEPSVYKNLRPLSRCPQSVERLLDEERGGR